MKHVDDMLCARPHCEEKEDRINGYCSIYCRDTHDLLLEAEESERNAYRRGFEEAKGQMQAKVDEWREAYAEDIFPEPPPGQHGKTRDACSASMGRQVAKDFSEFLRAMEPGE